MLLVYKVHMILRQQDFLSVRKINQIVVKPAKNRLHIKEIFAQGSVKLKKITRKKFSFDCYYSRGHINKIFALSRDRRVVILLNCNEVSISIKTSAATFHP